VWNEGPPHDAVPLSSGVTNGPWLKDGYVTGAAAIFTGGDGPCVQLVSVHDCVENLTVTDCGATVKMLDDCVQSFVHQCPSSIALCRAYMTECDETIVVPTGTGPDECRLRVE
jgi:hypothetical protein